MSDEASKLLNELTNGEDEFDVDLMACGCRFASVQARLDAKTLVAMFNLDAEALTALIDALVDAGNVSAQVLFELAAKAARRELGSTELA